MTAQQKPRKSVWEAILYYRSFGLVSALIILLIVAAFLTPALFRFSSLSAMLQNNAVYAVLAIGEAFVLLTGGIDISVGATLAVSAVTATRLMVAVPGIPGIVFVILGVAIGALCGLLNGVLIGRLKMVPLIVTLGTMYVFRGLAFVISGGEWIFPHQFTDTFMAVAQTKFLGLTANVWWSVALFIIAGLFLGLWRPGRRLYAVGTNEASAVVAGVDVARVKVLGYVLCGASAGLAGVLYSANYAMINSEIGAGYEMTAIAICILGGVSITGGRGRIDGIAIGTVMMGVITYMLSLLPGLSVWQNALQGAIIIVALIVNLASGRFAEKRDLRERGARL